MNTWEFTVNTGNAEIDRQTIENYRQQVAAQGVQLQITPMPGGGLHVRCIPGGATAAAPQQQAGGWPQQQSNPQAQAAGGWPQQQQAQPQAQQAAAWGQQASAGAWGGGGGAAAFAASGAAASAATGQSAFGAAEGAPALTMDRVNYLRKVYGLLTGSVLLACITGALAVTMGPTEPFVYTRTGTTVMVPGLVAMFLNTPALMGGAFLLLFVATLFASWVSKVRVLNVVMLFFCAALMGVELAPMIYVANVMSQFGDTLSANPVRDAGLMVLATFTGITAYVFITRKDFSYLRGILSMGVAVIFVACLLSFVFQSEIYAIAVASVGALLSAGLILYITSYIFRNSEMDDAVGDALALLVQLRNLFMFLLRIFMSRD